MPDAWRDIFYFSILDFNLILDFGYQFLSHFIFVVLVLCQMDGRAFCILDAVQFLTKFLLPYFWIFRCCFKFLKYYYFWGKFRIKKKIRPKEYSINPKESYNFFSGSSDPPHSFPTVDEACTENEVYFGKIMSGHLVSVFEKVYLSKCIWESLFEKVYLEKCVRKYVFGEVYSKMSI